MSYKGDYALGQTVYGKFATNAAAGSRVDFNNALEAADVRVYKNGSATERSSTAGFTVTSAFDSMVGVHHVGIDTSDDTDAGFYAAGNDYDVVLYPDETVDALSVAAVIFSFSIENRFPFMAARPTLSVGAIPVLGIVDSGTLQSLPTTTTSTIRAASAFGDNSLAGCVFNVLGGTLAPYWQSVVITSNVGTTDVLTHPAFTVTPTGTCKYTITGTPLANAAIKVPATIATGDSADETTMLARLTATRAGYLDNLSAGAVATATALGIVDDFLDTEVAAILAAVDTEVAAIKAKTDSLTFTVANVLDANVQRINDVPIIGDGGATPFNV